MEPLNQEERSKAMIRFMAFFAITIVLAVFAIYFDVLTQRKSGDINRERLKRFTNTEAELNRILMEYGKINSSIDGITFNPNDPSTHVMRHDLVRKNLDTFISRDSLLKPAVDTLQTCLKKLALNKYNFAEDVKNGNTKGKIEAENKELKEKVKSLETDLKDVTEELNGCKIALMRQ
jgi:hypothetical protein